MLNRSFYRNIKSWILLFFLFQLIFIRQAPIEKAHNWRQTLTNTIARNFALDGDNFMYPVVDHAGSRDGVIGTEFPIFNYTISKFIQIFGFQHWYGRLINLIVTCFGFLAFFQILKILFDEKLAFWACVFLMLSVWFTFSRKIMPDTLSISVVISGIYFCLQYLEKNKILNLIVGVLLISLGMLIKLPAAVILSPFALLIFNKNWTIKRRIITSVGVILAIIPTYWWYFVWVIKLNEHGFALFFTRSLSEGWFEIKEHAFKTIENIVFHSFYSFIGFGIYLCGLVLIVAKKKKDLLAIWLISTLVFSYFIIKTGITFPYHSYYMVPFAPIVSLVAAFAIIQIKNKKVFIAVLILFGIESIANQQDDLKIREGDYDLLQLETIADSFSVRNDQIICNGGVSPTLMYYLHRKGWTQTDQELSSISYIDSIATISPPHTPKFLFLYKSIVDPKGSLFSEKIFENDFLRVYKKSN